MSVNNKQKKEKQMKFNKSVFSLVLVLVLALGFSAFAQQGAGSSALLGKQSVTQTSNTPEPQTNYVSALAKEKSRVSYSAHSRGFLRNPKTGEVTAEIVTLRERGLWGNGCVTQILVDNEGNPMGVLNSSASAGPGIAMVQGASFVGGMYLFAEHLRPSKVNSDNNSSGNSGTGANTINNSNNSNVANGGTGGTATGGQGGNGQGGNGGNGTGGQGGNGGGRTHPNSPGNGGIPGNGGQNGNGHGHNPHANP